MAIYIDNKDIVAVTVAKKTIIAIYTATLTGAKLVWEAIRSCFGSGVWIPKKPWLGKEGWKERKSY